ncbi:hypothetical protein EZJ43_00230 [Pedobacter changchengzhani]|uniref:Uncharacterized protein n=1 Tax=Pedobacter changchengzhani TaxID=2529274 RepID=A0A4R5MPD8_9SPHI|nr:hypothetical protein [Pedobacter changchengzhani]TDG37558.1 hypothetical protein EZJ43_00230 [Pedobacter changchengzhani]
MKSLTTLFFFLITSTATTKVYICKSNGATKYHLKTNCRGLSSCNYKTMEITLEKAKKEGKKLCAWED